jgi:hypothetical protein
MLQNWELLPLFVGFLLEFVLYTRYKFRAGGVIVIPLLATYLIKYPALVPSILFATVLTFLVLEIAYSNFIIYGRRLLYISLMFGLVVFSVISYFRHSAPFTYAFLMPGLMAYNFHREKHSPVVKFKSMAFNTGVFILLVFTAFLSLIFF